MPIIGSFLSGGSNKNNNKEIQLAPVSNVSVLTAHDKIHIKWTDPEDLTEETASASWAGTLLLRKAGSMPLDHTDGTIVLDNKQRNAYSNTYFCDSGLSPNTTYYYKFFPYSTAGTYTENEADEFQAATRDIQMGIVQNIKCKTSSNKIELTWTDPKENIIQDGVVLATWGSTKVVYKTGSFAALPEEGTLVINSTTRNAYYSNPLVISGLTNGVKYNISLFPISTDGVVSTAANNRISATPHLTKIPEVPSQSGTLIYTGNEQYPTWNNYDTTKLSMSGEISGVLSGSYTVTFTPKEGYCWNDNTTTAKTVMWDIGKASGSSSISVSELTLNATTPTGTIIVNRLGDGVVTAISSNTNVATVSVSGNIITVNNVNQNSGTCTITVQVAEGTNYTSPENKTCTVNAKFISTTLNNNSWDIIREVSDSGQGANYWSVGDAKKITLNGTLEENSISNFSVWTFILGFNHNSAKEGSNKIHFQIGRTSQMGGKNAMLNIPILMASKASNAGGWEGCYVRKYCLKSSTNPTTVTDDSDSYMGLLPADLKAVMKSCTKYTDNTANGSFVSGNVTATNDYLWLLSEFELCGTRTYANSAEQNYQVQYDYYKNGNSKIFYDYISNNLSSSYFSAREYWLRSPFSLRNNTDSFCLMSDDGDTITGMSATTGNRICPAFCV